jgi:hypothetical protein
MPYTKLTEQYEDGSFLAIVLMMEAASTSETSVKFYQTTRRCNPEDSHLHTRCHENLKSYLLNSTSFGDSRY